MLTNTRDVEIEWGDCDAAGIVFYPRYFAMFDASTAYLLEKGLGMKKIAWTKKFGIVGIPMVDTGAKFSIPSRYGDVVAIESTIRDIRRSSFDVAHRVLKDGKVAIEGHETRVWTGRDPEDPSRIKAVAMPDEVVAALSAS
ncbi:MAG: acyl-CoA thioesterase [Rhizobiaceae bacterium]|nr:acyl-CoA thioesterase [Rhizobiaceae bacterium]